MKKLIIIIILISTLCYSQQQDTLKQYSTPNISVLQAKISGEISFVISPALLSKLNEQEFIELLNKLQILLLYFVNFKPMK
ncbi:hypothetical protein BH10BAC5_BH10BAC5_16860 [soil metagenome]